MPDIVERATRSPTPYMESVYEYPKAPSFQRKGDTPNTHEWDVPHHEDIYVASSLTISESLREIPKGQRQDACKRLFIMS